MLWKEKKTKNIPANICGNGVLIVIEKKTRRKCEKKSSLWGKGLPSPNKNFSHKFNACSKSNASVFCFPPTEAITCTESTVTPLDRTSFQLEKKNPLLFYIVTTTGYTLSWSSFYALTAVQDPLGTWLPTNIIAEMH